MATWVGLVRNIRAEVLSLKTRDYVAAARVAGGSDFRIMYRHILPGVLNLLMVLASLRIGGLILAEASLSYLGVGVPSRYPSWGNMISDGREFLDTAWWVSFFPGFCIFLVVHSTSSVTGSETRPTRDCDKSGNDRSIENEKAVRHVRHSH